MYIGIPASHNWCLSIKFQSSAAMNNLTRPEWQKKKQKKSQKCIISYRIPAMATKYTRNQLD